MSAASRAFSVVLVLLVAAGAAVWVVPNYLAQHDDDDTATTNGSAFRPAAPAAPKTTSQLVEAMAVLAGTLPAKDNVDEWAKKLDAGTPIDAYIDSILASKRFSHDIVPALVFGTFVNVRNYYALPSAFVLKKTGDADDPIYYLRAPCRPSETTKVHPWWNRSSTVRVCPDSYRPDKWTLAVDEHSYRSRMPLSCDSQVGSPELEMKPLCGCGPDLIRCVRDDDQYTDLTRSMMDEIKQTTAYVVEHDLPVDTLFTGNETFRDRNMELYYRRQKISTLHESDVDEELAALDTWPEGGQWAPRPELVPGQHAGVLTAPQILHWLPDRRQRQRGYYEIMWCSLKNSFGATTQKVLELNANTGNLAFVHETWKRLAHTELCMNCHARLDYGFQFFMGYPDSRAGTHYDPDLQLKGEGPLYARDIDDPRGTGPLTPAGFAKLATAQPEFHACMAQHFTAYVLGEHATADDRAAIQAAVDSNGQIKAAMKVALERFAQRWREEAAASAPAPAPPVVGAWPGMAIAVGPALRAQLDRHCTECHDKGNGPYVESDGDDKAFDLTTNELPRAVVVRMTDRVAFGMMPKDAPLSPADREQVVTTLIASLWSDPDARREAERYYLGREHALPAQQIDNELYVIDELAHGKSSISWGALERGLWSDQSTITPGFVALSALEALDACLHSTDKNIGLDACLARTIGAHTLARWPSAVPFTGSSP